MILILVREVGRVPESNYTAFVEIVVPEGILPGKNIIGRRPYMIPRKPGKYVYPDKVTFIRLTLIRDLDIG